MKKKSKRVKKTSEVSSKAVSDISIGFKVFCELLAALFPNSQYATIVISFGNDVPDVIIPLISNRAIYHP